MFQFQTLSNLDDPLQVMFMHDVGYLISSREGYFRQTENMEVTASAAEDRYWGTATHIVYQKALIKHYDRFGRLRETESLWTVMKQSTKHMGHIATAGTYKKTRHCCIMCAENLFSIFTRPLLK